MLGRSLQASGRGRLCTHGSGKHLQLGFASCTCNGASSTAVGPSMVQTELVIRHSLQCPATGLQLLPYNIQVTGQSPPDTVEAPDVLPKPSQLLDTASCPPVPSPPALPNPFSCQSSSCPHWSHGQPTLSVCSRSSPFEILWQAHPSPDSPLLVCLLVRRLATGCSLSLRPPVWLARRCQNAVHPCGCRRQDVC